MPFLLILPQSLTQLYKVNNFKSHFFKNPSKDFFETLDLSCPLSTLKKLLASFCLDIFSFQDITEDRCDVKATFISIFNDSKIHTACLDHLTFLCQYHEYQMVVLSVENKNGLIVVWWRLWNFSWNFSVVQVKFNMRNL